MVRVGVSIVVIVLGHSRGTVIGSNVVVFLGYSRESVVNFVYVDLAFDNVVSIASPAGNGATI